MERTAKLVEGKNDDQETTAAHGSLFIPGGAYALGAGRRDLSSRIPKCAESSVPEKCLP